jgi:hypothetical protein
VTQAAVKLKLDWCNHDAAKWACRHWHYSKSIPPPPRDLIGVWENDRFIGCVIFSRGANRFLFSKYGLAMTEGCELTRIALRSHQTPVSKIISIALRFLKKQNPGLRMAISFADPAQGHHGGIYQATNWIFCGSTSASSQYIIGGKKLHQRQVSVSGFKRQFGTMRAVPKPEQCRIVHMPGKLRYVLPFDDAMREQLEKLRLPYPKRVGSETKDTPGDQPGKGGAAPTPTLHNHAT